MAVPSKPSFFRRLRIFTLSAVGLALLILLEPHSFSFLLKRAVLLQAARHGVSLEIGAVEGNIFEPIVFRDIRLTTSRAAAVFKISAGSAEVILSWGAINPLQQKHGFFHCLKLDRVAADVAFQPYAKEAAPGAATNAPETHPWLPVPARVEVANSGLVFHMGKRKVTFADVRFTVSSSGTGIIAIEKLTFEQGNQSRSFQVLRGTTALQGARWRVADLNLSDGVVLTSLSSNLADMLRGELQADFDFAAFGGSLRGELLNSARSGERTYEVAGNFSNISVEALGRFLNVIEKTGGIIKEGKFTFQGLPNEPENATISTRFEATDFRWGKRQWNSLVLGATVINRRVQIPELELQQAHNILRLKGELTLPAEETPWWLSDFSFDVAARIKNLGELSVLFGPQFADTAGNVTIDGSIRGAAKAYSGQLLIAGTKLAWRGVPFDLFNAGIKLEGNELQIINLEAVHGQDFVRGKGSVTILGENRYQGELNASIEELAAYKALLQKPIVPAPPSGRLVVNWSGDGTTGAHSGAFNAHFRKLRTDASGEIPATLPIDADLEGTYAPGGLVVSRCTLANQDTRLEGRLAADEKTLKLEGLKLTQKKTPWLEGDATLPFNLFQWWVNPSFAALAPDAPFKAQLTAKGVQLEEVAHLTGRAIPIRGLLTGTLKTESTLRNLFMTGSVKLSKGQIPGSEWIPALDKLEAEADIDGNVLRFSKVSASHALGDFSATGSLDLSKFDNPAFDLLVHGEKVRFTAGPAWEGTSRLDLTITGIRDTAAVNGVVEILSLETAPKPDFGALISTGNPETIRVPAPAMLLKAPFDRWVYDVRSSTSAPLKSKKGTLTAEFLFSGTGSPLNATGSVTLEGVPVGVPYAIGKLESGTWQLGPTPTLVAHLTGNFLGGAFSTNPQPFEGYYLGALNRPTAVFWSNCPEDSELIQKAFTPGAGPLPEETAILPVDVGPMIYNPEQAAALDAKDAAKEQEPATPPPPAPQATP